MLEIAAVKPNTKTGDPQSNDASRATDSSKDTDSQTEFQSEYEATTEAETPSAPEIEVEATKAVDKETGTDVDILKDNENELSRQFAADNDAVANAAPVASGPKIDSKEQLGEHLTDVPRQTNDVDTKTKIPDVVADLKNEAQAGQVTEVIPTNLPKADGLPKPSDTVSTQPHMAKTNSAAELAFLSKAAEQKVSADASKTAANAAGEPLRQAASASSAPPTMASNTLVNQSRSAETANLTIRDTAKFEKEEKPAARLPVERVAPAAAQPQAGVASSTSIATAPTQMAPAMAMSKEKIEVFSISAGDTEALGLSETRSWSSAPSSAVSPIFSRADTPVLIAKQLADAIQKSPDKPIEITLSPKELGKVRMSLSTAEAGITMSISAERPETLDLLRRNIEQLAKEFFDIGYQDINFAFSQGGSDQNFAEDTETANDAHHIELTQSPDEQIPVVEPETLPQTGVDIRL